MPRPGGAGPARPATTRHLRRGKRHPHLGLTLLELLVTIAVLAVLLGTAVPSMHSLLERNRLRAAAQALAEDLQWARSEAVKRNRAIELSLLPEAKCYGIGPAEPRPCDCRLLATDAGGCALKRVSGTDLHEIGMTATFSRTVFESPRGTARNGSLTLQNGRGTELRVVLSRLGRVRICAPGGDMPGYESC